MSEGLPKGWAQAPVSRVAIVNPRHPRDLEDSIEVSFAPMACLSESSPTMEGLTHRPLGQVRTGFTHFAEGDVLFAKITPCMENGKGAVAVGLKNGLGCGTTELHILRPTELIDATYLYHFTHQASFRKRAEARFTGSAGQARVPVAFFDEAEIPVPPIAEQHRIVAKLEAMLAKVDASRKRLERIPVILKRFRQAVLAAACDGRLTEDWRTGHGGIEPASKVLNGLRTPDPEPFLNTFGDTSTRGLPGTWSWVPLGKLGRTMGGGTPSKENEEFWSGSIPWVSPKDMKRDRIADSQDHISEKALRQSPVNQIPKGAILFVIRGMILNHTLPVAITDSVVTINQDMKALVPEIPEIAEFLFLASKYLAPAILFEVKEATHGTRRIETPLLKNWAVPFPPLLEQQEIIRRVSEMFVFADQIEARYAKAQAQVDRLTQSILAKAFRGELVPQDPSDEPADLLLSRLGAAPTESSAPARRRGRPPRLQPAAPPVAPAAPAEDREAPVLADLTLDAILQAHRDVLASIPSPLDEDQFLRAMALRLGFQRLGSRIKARLRFVLLQEGIRLS